ncbi:MAG: NINE protein [Asgard group archaeon]|nr:NINE protein [Asgard group archaeon]
MANNNRVILLLVCFFLGFFGIHRFLVGKYKSGMLYLCTGGFLGIGVYVDIFLILTGKFTDKDGQPLFDKQNMDQSSYYETSPQRNEQTLHFQQTTTGVTEPIIFKNRDDNTLKKFSLKLITVKYPPENEICMISKLPINQYKEIVKCPYCFSFFIKEYIIDWIVEKENCPVCKQILQL